MSPNKEKRIHNIESRLQLLLTITIFFPALLSAFFNPGNSATDTIAGKTIVWFSLVGGYLIIYTIFQFTKRSKLLPENTFKILDGALFLGIVLYIFPIIFFATTDPQAPLSSLSWMSIALFYFSLWGLPALALLTFLFSVGMLSSYVADIIIARRDLSRLRK